MSKLLDWSPKVERFEEPLKLDLKPFASVRSATLPPSVKRLLSRINQSQDPSPDLGFFTSGRNEIADSYDRMNDVLSVIQSKGPDSLLRIEMDNAQKVVNASGRKAYAYFMTSEYPWMVEGPKIDDLGDTVRSLSKVIKGYLDRLGYPAHIRPLTRPASFGNHPYPIGYKKGSSYGIYPYVPGSSKLNGLALVWHAHACNTWVSMANKSSFSPEVLVDAVNQCSDGDVYTDMPYGIMMIMRARPMGKTKMIPRWRIDKTAGILTATEGEWGMCAGTREIKAVPAFVNIAFSSTAQMFTSLFNAIPGLHVGHQILSPNLAAEYSSAVGTTNVEFYAEDISGYDNSVGTSLLASMHDLLVDVWGKESWDREYLQFIDKMPIISCNVLDDAADKNITVMNRMNGIASGFQGTTLYGTTINLISLIAAISSCKGKSAMDVIGDSCNFTQYTGSKMADCHWGVLLKGDDVLLFLRKGYINVKELQDARLRHGLKTEAEPAPLFLMQYIDTKTVISGSDYEYHPQKFRGLKTFKSHGLMAKRIGNRTIFVEHSVRDPRPARLAIAANLSDLPFHPAYLDCRHHFIDILNRHDDRKWSMTSLMKYVASDEAKADMADYAITAGRTDPYIRELVRRRYESQGGISGDQALDTTNLDDINDLIDDIANIPSYGIKELSQLESVKPILNDISATDKGAWLSFNERMPSSAISKKVCKKIIKILLPKKESSL